MPKHDIYILISPSNKCYIGQTMEGLDRRWIVHCSSARNGSSLPIHRAMNRYGLDSFERGLLVIDISNQEDTNIWEQLMVRRYDSYNSGYNCTIGGDGISGFESPLKGTHLTKETKQKISKANIGRFGVMKGKTHPENTKKKMSESQIGNYPSLEARRKMSLSKKGVIFSDSHRKNLSVAAKLFWERIRGEDRSNFVKTEEGKTCGKCLQFKIYEEYYNIRDICKECVRIRERKYT